MPFPVADAQDPPEIKAYKDAYRSASARMREDDPDGLAALEEESTEFARKRIQGAGLDASHVLDQLRRDGHPDPLGAQLEMARLVFLNENLRARGYLS